MGIKHFFYWFKNSFSESIDKISKNQTFADEEIEIEIDNFMIDLNGLFHNAAQKVYQYGAHALPRRLLGIKSKKQININKKNKECFRDICLNIQKLVNIARPSKRLILCVDGPAPLSKQNQQRQRRFRSALDRKNNDQSFDSNCITPGTKWMNYLTKYIDWWIRNQMSSDPYWKKLEVIFSNEKVPGEGEHKIINYIRLYGNPEESYCIQGADADLIMLSLGTHYPKFYILRDDMYDEDEFFAINIGDVRGKMSELLRWPGGEDYDPTNAINDFILMCYLVGNDFLPHIPCIEIIQKGIETMIDVYKNVAEEYGHLTEYKKNGVRFVKKSFEVFLGTLSQYEKGILQDKMKKKDSFFPDPVLESCSRQDNDGNWDVDIVKYREKYYSESLPEESKNMRKLCHSYLEGLQWVLTYYTKGVSNWKWRYPSHYAPFAFDLANHMKTFHFPIYGKTRPTTPFIQLLSVLPPKSSHLIPSPLCTLLTSEDSSLKKFCPEDFDIDMSGKRQEWEGIAILPMIDYGLVEKLYVNMYDRLNKKDIKRNIVGKSFIYRYSQSTTPYMFKSFYGNIMCKVNNEPIDI